MWARFGRFQAGVRCGLFAAALAVSSRAGAGETNAVERNVDGISDNSFLVEEAYNQEAGVVQHIFTAFYSRDRMGGPDDKRWDMTFTQEWPAPNQKHQLSYTVPYSFVENGGTRQNGFGDVLLNYRYQAYYDENTLLALAPRVSLILPTGDKFKGLGEGTVGYQFNLPFSTAIGDSWFAHLNGGFTFLPNAASANGRDLVHYNTGASVIYAPTRTLHFMVECVGYWNDSLRPSGDTGHDFACILSPGIRRAFNCRNNLQIVLGVAAPIGLNGNAPDFGAFLYASFEHPFRKVASR